MTLTMEGGLRSAETFIEKAIWFYDQSFKPDGEKILLLEGYDRLSGGRIIDGKDAHRAIETNIKSTLESCQESGVYTHLRVTVTLEDDHGEGGFHMSYRFNTEIDPSQYFSLVRIISDDEYKDIEETAEHYKVELAKQLKKDRIESAKFDAEMKSREAKRKRKPKAKRR